MSQITPLRFARTGAAGTALVAVLACSLAASAGAAVPRIADLTIELEGVQRTTWETHHIADGPCDSSRDGSGSETYRFRSPKVRVRAFSLPRGGVVFVRGGRPVKLPLAGLLTRTGTILRGPSEQVCAAGDGTGAPAPAPPDCGTRRVRNAVEIAFGVRVPDELQISDGDAVADPFANCPTGVGEQFPTIMAFDGNDRRIGRRLPARDLFGYGRNIVIARGTKRTSGGDTTAETTVRWTATLTRVRRA